MAGTLESGDCATAYWSLCRPLPSPIRKFQNAGQGQELVVNVRQQETASKKQDKLQTASKKQDKLQESAAADKKQDKLLAPARNKINCRNLLLPTRNKINCWKSAVEICNLANPAGKSCG